MAFGLYEYPHTDYYDSDLSEVLKLYKKLVEDYNEIVEKLYKAEADWQYSIDYVENWNQKWQNDIHELRQEFVETSNKIIEVQQELITRFEIERLGITNYVNDVLQQIKDNNASAKEYIAEDNARTIEEISERITAYQNNLKTALESFESMFDRSLTEQIQMIRANLTEFKEFIRDELDTIMALFESYEASVNAYYNQTATLYNNLIDVYAQKLETHKGETYKQIEALKPIIKEGDDAVLQQLNDQVQILREEIDEVDKARVDIQADKVLIKSPITRVYKRIQWVLDEMWTFYGAWAIEAREFDDLHITAEEFDNWICDIGSWQAGDRNKHTGIEALKFDAMARWILLEKPDILKQLKGQIEQITYDKLAENEDRIIKEVTDASIATAASYFAQIVNTVTVIAGKLQPMQEEIDTSMRILENHENAINKHQQAIDMLDGDIHLLDDRIESLEITTTSISSTVEQLVTSSSIANARLDNIDANVETLINLQEAMDDNIVSINETMANAKLKINDKGNFTLVKGE